MDERLSRLAAESEDQDVLMVELIYHNRWVTFDISAAELKYLPMTEIIERYFSKGFAAVRVTVGEEVGAGLASSSATSVKE